MPGILHEHVVAPPQTLPETVSVGQTEQTSLTEESLETSQVEERQVEDQTVEALVAHTHRQYKRYHKFRNRFLFFGIIAFMLAVSPLLMYWPVHVNTLITLMLLNVVLFSGGMLIYRLLRKWTSNAQNLEDLDDVRAVGPLVEMFSGLEPRSQDAARKSLIDLLPRLQSSDTGLLDANQRRLMRRFLGGIPLRRFKEHSPLAIAILQAYEKIGDREDLPIVERLARGYGWAADPQVRAAATACLTPLRQIVEMQRDPQTLLRASADTVAAGEILLRPAQGTSGDDAGMLLRAGPDDPNPASADKQQGTGG